MDDESIDNGLPKVSECIHMVSQFPREGHKQGDETASVCELVPLDARFVPDAHDADRDEPREVIRGRSLRPTYSLPYLPVTERALGRETENNREGRGPPALRQE